MATQGGAAPDPAGAGEPAIRIESLQHVYRGGTTALDGVDLDIGRGLFGLLGPNGAGKSTLMRIVCALLRPTAGRVTVLGHDPQRHPQAVRRRLGYLPQEFGGWRLQRVGEMLDTLARLSGLRDAGARRRRVESVLDAVGLAEHAHRKTKHLSGGMVRRLGVAQALVHEPDVLVVDEPTVGLDPQERLRFRALVADLAAERTIVLSTHIIADLGHGCRDMALLDAGEVVYRGSPGDLLERARGRVFEMTLPVDGESQLGPEVDVVSRTRDGVGVRVRAVTAGGLPEGAVPVETPTLEEGYLAFMLARGRRVDEVVEEQA
jgi:ABC-type multidrug transport system ATPase subunit